MSYALTEVGVLKPLSPRSLLAVRLGPPPIPARNPPPPPTGSPRLDGVWEYSSWAINSLVLNRETWEKCCFMLVASMASMVCFLSSAQALEGIEDRKSNRSTCKSLNAVACNVTVFNQSELADECKGSRLAENSQHGITASRTSKDILRVHPPPSYTLNHQTSGGQGYPWAGSPGESGFTSCPMALAPIHVW